MVIFIPIEVHKAKIPAHDQYKGKDKDGYQGLISAFFPQYCLLVCFFHKVIVSQCRLQNFYPDLHFGRLWQHLPDRGIVIDSGSQCR